MENSVDLYTIIIIITFLGTLLFLAFLVNKKKDFFKSHINKNKSIGLITSSILGGGNRAILFEVDKKKFLVISNKNSLSNILPIAEISSNQINEKQL